MMSNSAEKTIKKMNPHTHSGERFVRESLAEMRERADKSLQDSQSIKSAIVRDLRSFFVSHTVCTDKCFVHCYGAMCSLSGCV